MTLVYACVAPHGGEIIPALAGKSLRLFGPTRKGMREIARSFKAARPSTVVLATPHSLRLHRNIAVVTSEHSSGVLEESGHEVRLDVACDIRLAWRLVEESNREGLPVVAANYGTASGPLSNLPLDWGALVPLWFLVRLNGMKCRVVLVAPSREVPLRTNYDFGRLVGRQLMISRKREAFVASADQAHAHRKDGPYGFNAAASVYDAKVVRAVKADRLESLLRFPRSLVENAKPDSLWQMAMLAGVLKGSGLKGTFVSYQRPTYYGMLCASYSRD